MNQSVFMVSQLSVGLLLAYLLPFVLVLRGARLKAAVARSWGLLFLYVVLLCMVIPLLVSIFNRDLAAVVLRTWVPEGTGVAAIAFMGWLPPLVAGSVALLIRWMIRQSGIRLTKEVSEERDTIPRK